MSGDVGSGLTASDEALVERTRSGDQRAFGELWRRHYRSGERVARQFTSSIDADDLVSEAYTRIYQRVRAGGGPTGAFRPYLYTTIRNLASSWGSRSRDVQVDDMADFEDPGTIDDPAAQALDRTLTARAFRTLPDRWQSVLWYTEVEGMDPHEVAPLMGMTANGVAALSYRAREGLRKAWLQAHINDATASGECRWAISRLGEHARNGLGARDSARIASHLNTCARCEIISEEVDEVGSRLALVLLPILLGGVAGGALLSSAAHTGTAAVAGALPALPKAIGAAAGGTAGLLGPAATPLALVGGLAIAVALGGGLVAGTGDAPGADGSTTAAGSGPAPEGDGPSVAREEGTPSAAPVDPAGVEGVLADAASAAESLVGAVTDEGQLATVSLSLTGTGTPGAQVTLQALGQVYATTTVGASGDYALSASVPAGLASLDLVQTVDRQYLSSIAGPGLGGVDRVLDSLVRPLALSGASGGITVTLVG